MRSLNFFLSLIPALFLFLISAWSISFGFVAGYLGLILIISEFVIGMKKNSILILMLIPVFWIIINAIFLFHTINSYDLKRINYAQKINNHIELSTQEKFNIYGLNVLISVLSYLIYPEASIETFYLIFQTENNIRKFESDFFLKSNKIKKIISQLSDSKEKKVSWNLSEYSILNPEARFALALNPCIIKKITIENKTYFEVKVRVSYPEKTEAVLLDWPVRIVIEEGLFWYLQKSGWLHPYEAVWFTRQADN
jgi:hypothetical protein